MHGERRFSQAISDGDRISLVASAADDGSAHRAAADGATALVAGAPLGDHTLPVLWRGSGGPQAARNVAADACVLVAGDDDEERLVARYAEVIDLGLDCVVEVADEDEMERVLEALDPEVFLLTPGDQHGEEALERVLELLEDVPAGKLAVADLTPYDEVELAALERAGVDAVIVPLESVAVLAAATP
jgi:hypothetical protein